MTKENHENPQASEQQSSAPDPKNRQSQNETEEDDDHKNGHDKPNSQAAQKFTQSESAASSQSYVAKLVGIGFKREKVIEALQLASNNPDQTFEYLLLQPLSPPSDKSRLQKSINNSQDALQKLRFDPMFVNLHRLIQTNPELMPDILH